MDRVQFKESGCVDVDEAKFKQTVFLCGPPRKSEHMQLETLVQAEAAPPPFPLPHRDAVVGAPY